MPFPIRCRCTCWVPPLIATTACSGAPGYNTSGTQALPADQLYFAQLSNRLLLPPARLLFSGIRPRLFGAGWLALPLVPLICHPTASRPAATIGRCSSIPPTSKGAVGFSPPGLLVNEPGMVTASALGWIPATAFRDASGWRWVHQVLQCDGFSWHAVSPYPRLTFGADEGQGAAVAGLQALFKSAAWEPVRSWIDGGAAPAT